MANSLIDFSVVNPEASGSFLKGFQGAQERQQAQVQQERQNKLADLQFRAAQRGEEEALAEREAYKNQDPLAALRAAGLGKQALAYEKQQQDRRAAQINQAKDALGLQKASATSIFANPDPAYAKQKVLELQKLTGQDMSGDIAQIDSFGGDPAKLKNWAAGHAMDASNLLTKFETRDTGGAVQRQGYDPITGAPVGPAQVTQKTATPGERMTDARARAQMAQSERQFAITQANQGKAPAAAEKPLTEAQGKATGFALRAKEADEILKKISYLPAAVATKQAMESYPVIGGVLGASANLMLPEQAQQADQAQRSFVNAILRQESGAAISESEFQNARKQYFPQPGDGNTVIEQKKKNRETAIRALETAAGPGMGRVAQPSPQLSARDQQALDWANANAGDPRSAQIKQRLGVQ
tara:strand:- start:2362 stop:3600 length:1239 start_codon:yes stop_codon:yes gene_type:complete